MRSFVLLWLLAFSAFVGGALFQVYMHPDLRGSGISFAPDVSRVADLLDGPGRMLGNAPALFLLDAAILSGLFAVVFAKEKS